MGGGGGGEGATNFLCDGTATASVTFPGLSCWADACHEAGLRDAIFSEFNTLSMVYDDRSENFTLPEYRVKVRNNVAVSCIHTHIYIYIYIVHRRGDTHAPRVVLKQAGIFSLSVNSLLCYLLFS